MKIVIPGGTGHVGGVLRRALQGHEVVILGRGKLGWDGRSLGPWTRELEGADAVINLAGRSVNCRYTADNLTEMLVSRMDSARVVGEAIAKAENPPRLWLQMSTATIYAHTFGEPNGEDGALGGNEPDVPTYWRFSVEIAKAWEREQELALTPRTRKVALRSSLVLSPDKGGIFDTLLGMTRLGASGAIAGGRQFISWIHEQDFVRAVEFIIASEQLSGPINLASPNPLPQRELMRTLRKAAKVPVGLPAAAWMVSAAAVLIRSDPELLLKSRKVIPRRLLERGFKFDFPDWPAAAGDLLRRHAARS